MTRRYRIALAATVVAASLALLERPAAQLSIDAGADFDHELALSAQLTGVATNRRPYDFWIGDGDLENEDRFVGYDNLGERQSGVLLDPGSGTLATWPSDVVEIAGTFYGVETGNQFLWRLTDFDLGHVEQIGPTHAWPWITCLAYDHVSDTLYAVDGSMKRLLIVDRASGAFTATGAYLTADQPYWYIKGLAYDETTGLLFAIEDNTETLFTIDPANNAQTSYVMDVPSAGNLYDEIQFYDGLLYASYKSWDAAHGWWTSTVRRIDYVNGVVYDVGPAIEKMSPHTLLIRSFPEELHWSQVSGPDTAVIATPWTLATEVSFALPGSYVFQLETLGSGAVSDLVQVEVWELDCNANGVDDELDIANASSTDSNANGLPDECEVLVYCTAKTNSLGCVPQVSASGSASLSSPDAFVIEATQVLNQRNGLLFYGYQGWNLDPFQGGTLCVLPPLRRLPVQSAGGTLPPVSNCSGVYSFEFNAHAQSGLDTLISPGTQINAQWWSRDPGQIDGSGAGLSDAVQFVIGS